MARRRRRARKRSGLGRLLEGMAVLVLFLVILTFGFSIASRYAGEEPGLRHEISTREPTVVPVVPPRDGPSFDVAGNRVQMVVENGCGRDGLAREFSEAIRGPRFDVVDYRDAAEYDHARTRILTTERGRQGAQELLRELEARWNVGEIQVTTETIYGADLRVVLGTDLAEIWNRQTNVP